MSRRAKILLFVLPLLLAGLLSLGLVWLMRTSAGAHWVLGQVTDALDGRLTVSSVSGDLANGLVLEGLVFEDESARVEIPRLQLSVDLDLLIRRVTLTEVVAGQPRVDLKSSDSQDGTTIPEILDALELPLNIEVVSASVSGLSITQDGEPLLDNADITLSGSAGEWIEIASMAFATEEIELDVNGWLDLDGNAAHLLAVTGNIDGSLLAEDLQEPIRIEASFSGDAARTQVGLTAGPPGLRLMGEVFNPLDYPRVDLRIETDEWVVSGQDSDAWRFTLEQGEVKGRPEAYSVDLTGVLAAGELDPVPVRLEGEGNLSAFTIDRLEAAPEPYRAQANGSLDWSGDLVAQLAIDLRAADSDLVLQGQVAFDAVREVVEGEVRWQALSWPLLAEEPLVLSPGGRLDLSGTPDAWQVAGELEVATPEYPGGQFVLSAEGGMDSARLDIERGEALGGTLDGQASLDWFDDFRWQAELQLQDTDLGAVLPDWPARLNASLQIEHDTGVDRLALEISDLVGQFRGEALSGRGGLVWVGSDMQFKQVRLDSDHSRIALDGSLQHSDGIRFDLEARRPGWLAGMVGGQLAARGQFAPAASNPLPELEAQGVDLRWGQVRVATLEAGTADPASAELSFTAKVTGLNLGLSDYGNAELEIKGTKAAQTVAMHVLRGTQRLEFGLEGALSDWQDLAAANWQGRLNALALESDGTTLLHLSAPAAIRAGFQGFDLERACLQADSGSLCTASTVSAIGGVEIQIELDELPLSLSEHFLEHDLEITQTLIGRANWTQAPGQAPSGSAAIRISAGRFGDTEEDGEKVETAEGFIGFELREGNLSAGQLDIPLPGVGMVDIDFEATGIALDGTGRLQGRALIDFDDLTLAEAFFPALARVNGQMHSDLAITGGVTNPLVTGSFQLEDAAFEVPYLGAVVRDMQVAGKVDESDRAHVQGTALVGEGRARLDAELQFADLLNPVLDITFSGEGLRLVDTPDLTAEIDTELGLSWQEAGWRINGEVEIPMAQLTPISTPVTRVGESADVVVVAGVLPTGPEGVDETIFTLSGELAVKLGEDVSLDADIASLQLTGDLELTWEDTLVPEANGAIALTGDVTAWGPRLTLHRSFVRFPGVAVNNPVLDIRAERDVFGNSMIRQAGVAVSGSARRPDIEAYTRPLTTRDRAWALLITGSDVNFGQGVGALDVGTYIAPRVFLSYGIGLFDNDNVVGIRYDLRRGFGVKATSGQRESGIDMSYTIDR